MSYRDRNVLVTGADGFIGSHLAETLVRLGAKVTALSQYNSFDVHGWLEDLPRDIRAQMKMERGDIRDLSFMRRLSKGQDTVFHLAALISIPHSYVAPQSYVDANVTGTMNVLECAREFAFERVVLTSTSEVYGTALSVPIGEDHVLQAQSPYAASKIAADMLGQAFFCSYGLPVAILRPFNTFGPRQSERAIIPTIIRQALDPACSEIRVGDLTPKRDITFVSDTVAAFLAIGSSRRITFGTPYNAGNGKSASIGELVAMIKHATDCQKAVVSVNDRKRPEHSEVRVLEADSRRMRQETGWTPQVSLSQGLRTTVEWWRSRLEAGAVRGDAGFIT